MIPGASLYAATMKLITVSEMSLWAEGSYAAIPAGDPLANWLIEQASELVMAWAKQPTWTSADAPGRAKILVANIAKRCWNNPDQELRSAIAGGPSSSLIDQAAWGLALTDAEKAECEALSPQATEPGAGGFWTLPISRGPLETATIVPDSSWPQSSPITYLERSLDPEYFPTTDDPLPVDGPDAEKTNTILEEPPVV